MISVRGLLVRTNDGQINEADTDVMLSRRIMLSLLPFLCSILLNISSASFLKRLLSAKHRGRVYKRFGGDESKNGAHLLDEAAAEQVDTFTD